jgi:hypothetical protein
MVWIVLPAPPDRAAVFPHDLGGQKAAGHILVPVDEKSEPALGLDFVNHGRGWLVGIPSSRATHLPGFCRRRATLDL